MAPALGGLLVVDLTSVGSGSTCTRILGDFGAEVVRVERPGEAGRDRAFFDHHPLTAPMGVCRARDGFLNVAVGNDEMWGRLCRALDLGELAGDPRFARNGGRLKRRAETDALPAGRLAARAVAELVTVLNEAEVACGPIDGVDDVFADPQVAQAGLVHEHEHPAYGPVKVLGLPVHLSRTAPGVRAPAPIAGADTRDGLARLGHTVAEAGALAGAGVIEVAT